MCVMMRMMCVMCMCTCDVTGICVHIHACRSGAIRSANLASSSIDLMVANDYISLEQSKFL